MLLQVGDGDPVLSLGFPDALLASRLIPKSVIILMDVVGEDHPRQQSTKEDGGFEKNYRAGVMGAG